MVRGENVALIERVVMRGNWGVEVRDRIIQQVEFVCPGCGLDRTGCEVEPQRWFAVAGLGIIPLATLPNEVVCDACGRRCDAGVLDVPTTAQRTRYLAEAVRSSVAFVVRAGRTNAFDFSISAAVAEVAISTMHSDGYEYSQTQLYDDVARLDDDTARANLRHLTDELTPHGTQSFLHRMAAIARASGRISGRQQRSLVEIGVALGMSAPHINGVLAVAALDLEELPAPVTTIC